ncbi:MAG: SDR family oxidoreductase [Bacteroidota bacterium]|nr:SDR family oxidoreductase [Bacteroidota bacterium]
MDKKDKIIWVTGASSGIGKETAKEFARAGFRVASTSRRHSILEMVNKELSSENLCVEVFACNTASSANVEQTVKSISAVGHIDCLINNAGITTFKLAEENSIKEIKEIVETNLLGAIYCIKAVLPEMIENKGGTIVNIISVAAEQVLKGSSAYSASKAGLLAYTDVLREEVRKYNIRIINILPGATYTPMWPKDILTQRGDDMMKPEEIAQLIVSAYLHDKKMITEKIIIKPIVGDL